MSTTAPATATVQSPSSVTSSSTTATCTTAVPGKYGAVPPDACNSYYNYNPNFPAAIAMTVLFGVVMIAHIVQAVLYKKKYCWVMIMMVVWETLSFILRALGAHNQQVLGYVIGYTLLMVLAPLWINAFAYMTTARLIQFLIPDKKVAGFSARWITRFFVAADITSFIVQGAGGSMLSGDSPANIIQIGFNVYRAGIGLQELFIVLFTFLTTRFHKQMLERERAGLVPRHIKWKRLTWTLYAVLTLITTRIIYRFVEFSDGLSLNNPLLTHEFYTYVLDGVPMLIAAILLNITHPGMVLQGPESEFPRLSRKEKKALKQEKKEAKQKRKEEKQLAKQQRKQAKEIRRAAIPLEDTVPPEYAV